ncbi:hypothetical protein PanWU01x14_290840 [Parasponia andersonii]|uniref:AT3G52170-like helix-turn-helix domain-containing protein n=1 Tax=Parasponia andersonii TaxID=3476 RepID=A0A2P5AXI8_PARAD|nr:hypothetical protein PanWU01x14_290840 [Parasponia andersonii]
MILRKTSKIVCSGGRTGKSYAVAAAAASVNKNENEISKASADLRGKKLPKAQRRAMVEAFVFKYKAMNDGKLPSTSSVVKQVGGSYYVVKKILQEVEYQLKLSVLNKANQKALGTEVLKEDERLFKSEEFSATRSNVSLNVGVQNDFEMAVTNHVRINDASDKHIDAERGSKSSSSDEKMLSEEIEVVNIDGYSELTEQNSLIKGDAEKVVHSSVKKVYTVEVENRPSNLLQEEFKNVSHHVYSENGSENEALAQREIPVFVANENGLQMMKTKKVFHPNVENVEDNEQKKAVSEDLQDKYSSKDKTEWHEGSPENKPAVDKSCRQTSDAEPPKKSTLWGNLKSFADGIFNIWRKS